MKSQHQGLWLNRFLRRSADRRRSRNKSFGGNLENDARNVVSEFYEDRLRNGRDMRKRLLEMEICRESEMSSQTSDARPGCCDGRGRLNFGGRFEIEVFFGHAKFQRYRKSRLPMGDITAKTAVLRASPADLVHGNGRNGKARQRRECVMHRTV